MKRPFLIYLSVLTVLADLACGAAQAADAPPAKIVLSPMTLRTQLLQGNHSLEVEERQVEIAKIAVGTARAGLFPSVNLTAALNGNFVLAGINFLVPFLVPSNWAALDQEKNLFESEKLSYKALELNTLSSVLAVYFNVLTDKKVAAEYQHEAKTLREIATLTRNSARFGFASQDDVSAAVGSAEAAEGQSSKMNAAVEKEIAALRQYLGLELVTEIDFSANDADATVAPSPIEGGTNASEIEKQVDLALSIGPEKAQIDRLISAAKDDRWSKVFGWINGATVSPKDSSSLSNYELKTQINLGLNLYPEIELSNENIGAALDRLEELKQETAQTLEGSLKALQQVKAEHDHFLNAEVALQSAYNSVLKQYQFGFATIYDVKVAEKDLASARISRIRADLDLTLLRLTLHRTMLTDLFAGVHGCDGVNLPENKKAGGLAGWFDGLFGKSDDSGVSLMELCREKPVEAP